MPRIHARRAPVLRPREARRIRGRPGEDRRDPFGFRRAGPQGRRPPRRGVRRVAPRVFRGEGEALRNEGPPDRLRPLRPRRGLPDRHRLQPPRRAAGRRPRLEHGALRLHPRGRQVPRPRHDRRQGTGDHGALRRAPCAGAEGVPLNIHFLWELEEEIGSPHFETTIRANAKEFATDSVVVSDTVWVSRDRPASPAGLRGLQGLRFELQTGETDQHSGTAGGAARNPVTELCAAHRRVRRRQDGQGQDPRLLQGRRPSDEEGARGPEEVRLHRQGLQEGPPLPLPARERRAGSDEADLDDADLRGPRDRRRLPGTGRQDDHPAQGDGHRVLPARAQHEPEEDREARHGLREEEEPAT